MQHSVCKNPKAFWKYIDNKKNNKCIPQTMYLNNLQANTSTDIANLFAQHFQNSTVIDNFSNNNNFYNDFISTNNDRISISISDVKHGIFKIKPSFSPGPDGIPSSFIKNCSTALLEPLQYLFDLSLSSSSFPDIWKKTSIIPVYKKGDKSNISNYRPISITSAIAKLIDSIVASKMNLIFKSVLSPYQHAGVKGRDIMSNLTIFSNFVHSSVANNIQVDTVYTDQTKAFDRVSHKILISKMHMYNIPLILIKWYKNFLAERVINCKINNILSTSFILNCGILKGLVPLVLCGTYTLMTFLIIF